MIGKYFLLGKVIFELGKVANEVRQQGAKSIRFELQKRVGKFAVYLDNSIYKEFDAGFGVRVVRTLVEQALKKKGNISESDTDAVVDEKITNEMKNSSTVDNIFNMKILPLPQGKGVNYKHYNKNGDIFVIELEVSSYQVKDLVALHLENLYNAVDSEDKKVWYIDDNGLEYPVSGINKNKMEVFLFNENRMFKVPIKSFNNKRSVDNYFLKFYIV